MHPSAATITISFIVVTYKRGELLQRCLESIYAQEGIAEPFELIVVDNGGDAAIAPPPREGILLRIERPEANLGVAGGRNWGIKRAKGNLLIFIDDDAVWHTHNDARRLVSTLEEDPQCAAVAVKSLAPDGTVISAELPHPNKPFLRSVTTLVPVPYFYGVGHAMKAQVLQQTGVYPERYFYSMEEVDLCLRIIDAGYTIWYVPEVAVFHHKSQLGRPVKGKTYWKVNALNKCRLALRLLSYHHVFTIWMVWSAAVCIKTGNVGLVWEMWRDLWRERKLLLKERKPISRQSLAYLRSIGARLSY